MTRQEPSPGVLAGFGTNPGGAVRLSGGEEISVLIKDVVFKRVDDVDLAAWTQSLLAMIDPATFRLARPIEADDGRWVVDGWTATEFIDNLTPSIADPSIAVRTGLDLSAAMTEACVEQSAVRQRTDRWARADRFVWHEERLVLSAHAQELEQILRSNMSDSTQPTAVVHGDLTGNVFIDSRGRPVVLDVTPYVRPPVHGSAVVVADHLLWHGASPDLVALIDNDADALARALLFRLVSEQLADSPRHGGCLDDYTRVIDLLRWR